TKRQPAAFILTGAAERRGREEPVASGGNRDAGQVNVGAAAGGDVEHFRDVRLRIEDLRETLARPEIAGTPAQAGGVPAAAMIILGQRAAALDLDAVGESRRRTAERVCFGRPRGASGTDRHGDLVRRLD